MAGIKNHYQIHGFTPYSEVKGDSIMDRHVKFQTREYTPYCQFCGREIVNSIQDENGHPVDFEWEQINRMHYRCAQQRYRR